jgi:HEPN superfamily Swt1-like protein
MSEDGQVYEFAFRGLLTEEALDRAGRPSRVGSGMFDADVAERLSLDVLDEGHVASAKLMAAVYVAVAAFENAARELVTTVLREAIGDDWWEKAVSSPIQKNCRNRQEDEAKHRFHTQRGDAPINYTDLKNLANVIRANQEHFTDFLPSAEWATAIFDTIERSRNVIMHSGTLDAEDVARVGMNLRDWVKQVGA